MIPSNKRLNLSLGVTWRCVFIEKSVLFCYDFWKHQIYVPSDNVPSSASIFRTLNVSAANWPGVIGYVSRLSLVPINGGAVVAITIGFTRYTAETEISVQLRQPGSSSPFLAGNRSALCQPYRRISHFNPIGRRESQKRWLHQKPYCGDFRPRDGTSSAACG